MRTTHRSALVLAMAGALVAGAGGAAQGSSDTTVTTASATADTEAMIDGSTPATDGDGVSEGMPECAETEGALVGYSEPIPDPNFALIEGVLESSLGRAGAELVAVNAELDPGKQISDIQALQQQGIDVLLINPVAPEVVQGALDEVRAAGIPIVVQDTSFGGPYATNVTGDAETAATQGAQILKDLVGDGQVAVIVGPPFAEVLVREAETFAEAAADVGLDVVETQTNQMVTPDGARQIAEAWKQQYPDLAGIWTFNDTSATGVASAFDESWSPALVSINGQPEAIPLIEAGQIDATFDLQQDMIGRALAFAAVSAICGEELPEQIWVQTQLIDESNVGDWVNPAERGQESIDVELQDIDGQTYLVAAP